MNDKNKFLLLTLENNKTQKIANIINNPSCKKILDFLTENEATETEISQKLKLPISTTHYNLKQLIQAKLIKWEKYHYSSKGKEVKHYTIANKYIIIVPQNTPQGILEKLKTFLPIFLSTLIGTIFIYLITKPKNLIQETDMATKSTILTTNIANEVITRTPQEINLWLTLSSNPIFWFLCGFIYTLLTIWIIKKIKK